jgi:hypothetical protein
MREVYYNSDVTPKADNEIKLLLLYYDKINIVSDAIYSPKFRQSEGKVEFDGVETIEFISQTFRSDYKLLIDENLIAITSTKESEEDMYVKLFNDRMREVLKAKEDFIFPWHPEKKGTKVITEEVYYVMRHVFGYEYGQPVDTGFIWHYYSYKLKWFIKLLMEGENCISSSNNLNALFSRFIAECVKSNKNLGLKGYSKSLALDALKISLPNPDILSIEDILELKLKLKDELALFYQTINAIEIKHKELFNTHLSEREYESVFFTEVQQPLNDLKNKMKNLNSKTFRGFVDKLQNPKTYVPLIGTVVASMPINYMLLSSLGLITGMSYLEYQEEKREIKANGLYFLLKL